MNEHSDSQPLRPEVTAPGSLARRWGFRLTAVLLGLLPFVLFELVCLAFGWGKPDTQLDPFVGFRETSDLFVLNGAGTAYEISPARYGHFRPDAFAAHKAPDEYRIFCLGGSTVQGEPYKIETSFTTWLEISLQTADPSRQWRVVNCGGLSYATYRLVPILREVLRHEPDLIVFCAGHNEFLESRDLAHIEQPGPLWNATLAAAMRLRSFRAVRGGYLRMTGRTADNPLGRRPILPAEVEALLDYRGGLAEYHRDDAWQRVVIEQYRFNVDRVIELTRAAGVPLVLMAPVSNLADTPPFKSEHRGDMTTEELARWESLCEQARACLHAKPAQYAQASEYFAKACTLDPLYAGGFYNLGKCREAMGDFSAARDAYRRAKDLDVCPLRMLEPMREILLDAAAASGTPLVDAQQILAERSRHGIVGRQWLVDHVHPTIEGHQVLADALLRTMVDMNVLQPEPVWEQARAVRYREHYESLGPHYFLEAKAHMENLAGWTQGRVLRLRGGGMAEPEDDRSDQVEANVFDQDNADQHNAEQHNAKPAAPARGLVTP